MKDFSSIMETRNNMIYKCLVNYQTKFNS